VYSRGTGRGNMRAASARCALRTSPLYASPRPLPHQTRHSAPRRAGKRWTRSSPPPPTLLPTTHPTVLSLRQAMDKKYGFGGRGKTLSKRNTFESPPPPPRTKWTRRVPHPVLIGHAASLSQVRERARHVRLFGAAQQAAAAGSAGVAGLQGWEGRGKGRGEAAPWQVEPRQAALAAQVRRVKRICLHEAPRRAPHMKPPDARHFPTTFPHSAMLSSPTATTHVSPPPPSLPRTNRTRRVPHPVLIRHAASFTPC
jgi:hypothetical protein